MHNDDSNDGAIGGQYYPVNKLICRSISDGNITRLSDTITERGLAESLLELDEEHDDIDGSLPKTVPYEIADSICAWQDVAPNAQITIQRKKRVPVRSADDVHIRRGRNDEINRYQKKTVESIFTTASIWRLCVEPTTFRYIPNNGRYRVSKHEHKLDRDSKIARTIRSMEKLSPEQRHLQKEIQRELRQEFELQQKLDRQAEQRQRLRAAEARRLESRGQQRGGERVEYNPEEQYRVPVSVVPRKPARDPLFHRRVKTPVELPPINVPLIGKAVQDNNYLDSFNVRIHTLEEEMKRDQVLLRKKQQENAEEQLQSSQLVIRARSEPVTNTGPPQQASTTKTSHYMDFSGLPLFSEPVTEDCLSVKPIAGRGRQRHANHNHTADNLRELSENNNNNEGLSSSRSSRSLREDDPIKTVFIKYTTSKGDVVRIPKFNSGISATSVSAPPTANTDQALVLRRSNGALVNGKTIKAGKEQGSREYYVNTNSGNMPGTFRYTSRGVNAKKGAISTGGVFVQDEEPPVIVAEGLFSRGKEGANTENIQVTVTKRKKEKGLDSLQQGLVPGVAGKNCELPQSI